MLSEMEEYLETKIYNFWNHDIKGKIEIHLYIIIYILFWKWIGILG